jgi:release factor glutamine methyltransferase
MTIEELIIYGKQFLHSVEVNLLLSRVTSYDSLDLINHLNDKLDDEQVKQFKALVKARKEDKPLQYILGDTNFYGLNIMVNEDVLIPRFETEELVSNMIELINNNFVEKNIKILDLCTGSGAIGLKLKSVFPESVVTLSDISGKALLVASKNSDNLGLDVEIINSDLFDKINDKYDVIISNPPYIRDDEEIEDVVKNNEPHLALYAGVDGLDYYRRILKDIKNYLKDKYIIGFEIGSDQREAIVKIINDNLDNVDNVDIVCKQDMSLKDRMIFIISK